MKRNLKKFNKGQSALEYLMLFGMVVILIIGGWSTYMQNIADQSDEFFQSAARAIYSHKPAARTFTTPTTAWSESTMRRTIRRQ